MIKLSNELLIDTLRLLAIYGTQAAAAQAINVNRTTFQSRVEQANKRFPHGIPDKLIGRGTWTHPAIKSIVEPNSVWAICSDLHIWPGPQTLIFEAFCKVAADLKVKGIVLNGDIIDGARVSRHGSMLGSKAPKIDKEIEAAQAWLKCLPRTKHRLWTLGNHDMRVDNYLCTQANELDDYVGNLASRFTDWTMAYAFDINGTEVRHRFRGGIHTAWNNALHSGVNIISGHTHQLQVTAMRDRNGSRWGIETGCIADPKGPQFEYTEGAPTRAQMGFAIITFDAEGRMMPPELCEMVGGRPVFRGQYVL